MPKGREDEENNYFNHFGLGLDKNGKQKNLRTKIPPKPPGDSKSASGLNGTAATDKKKLINQGQTDGKDVDALKASNKSDDDDLAKKAAADKAAADQAAADKAAADKAAADKAAADKAAADKAAADKAAKDKAAADKAAADKAAADKKKRYRDSKNGDKDPADEENSRKDRENKFMKWVTNGRDDDIHHCEKVLFH